MRYKDIQNEAALEPDLHQDLVGSGAIGKEIALSIGVTNHLHNRLLDGTTGDRFT